MKRVKEKKIKHLVSITYPQPLGVKRMQVGSSKQKWSSYPARNKPQDHKKKTSIYQNLWGWKIRKRETHIVDRNFNRNNIASLVGGPGIVILTEGHDIYTLGTQSWTHGWCRSGLPRLQSQLNHSSYWSNKRESRIFVCSPVISHE